MKEKNNFRILLMNGPPLSGKDTIAQRTAFPIEKLAKPLVNLVIAFYSLDYSTAMYLYHKQKDTAHERLNGLSFRQAMIELSEKVFKPHYGKDIWAKLLITRLETSEIQSPWVLVTDLGFEDESKCLLNYYGDRRVYLSVFSREGKDFKTDSRSYVDVNTFPPENVMHLKNDSTLEAATAELYSKLQEWQHGK